MDFTFDFTSPFTLKAVQLNQHYGKDIYYRGILLFRTSNDCASNKRRLTIASFMDLFVLQSHQPVYYRSTG